MRIESANASANASASASAWTEGRQVRRERHGSDGPRRQSGGPKRVERDEEGQQGEEGESRGFHIGQMRRALEMLASALENGGATATASASTAGGGAAAAGSTSSGTATAGAHAMSGLSGRLADVMDRLNSLTMLVSQASAGAAPGQPPAAAPAPGQAPAAVATAPAGNVALPAGFSATSSASGAAGAPAGGAGGAPAAGAGGASTAASASASQASQLALLMPFRGPTDFGGITINGVTTKFGIIDAAGGLSARQVSGSLVNIINSDPNQTVTAQQRDNKILLVAKDPNAAITVNKVDFGAASQGTMAGFSGFLDGMTGSGTLMSNPISPIKA